MNRSLIINKIFLAGTFLMLLINFTSCISQRKLKYFEDIPDRVEVNEVRFAQFEEPKIQSDDILVINVNSVDAEATEIINNGNQTTPSNGLSIANNVSQQLITGYLVDKDGNVEIPVLGKVMFKGLTTLQAKEAVRERAVKFYKDPTVNIRFSNFKVTVIGEVNRPSTYVVPNERVTVLDALGYAGDLTLFGKRENILLLRKQSDGRSVAIKLDLSQKKTLESPFFYLRQNDIIYVEPSRAKLANSDTSIVRYLGLAASLATVVVLFLRN